MSNLPISKLRALDADGDPISGALLYTYDGGTTDNNPTYSTRASAILDDGSTNANTNPVVADADGWFGEIYLTPDEAYKLVLKDADGNTIYTDDDVYAVQLSNSAVTDRIEQGFASPLDYPEAGVSAVGDGAADESSQVQNAIDASTGVVDLLGKTFRCDSAIVLKSGLTLRNGTLNFANCGDNSYIYGEGSVGDANLLTGDASRGDLTLSVTDGSGLAADDWLLLYSDDTWDGTDKVGELLQVHSVASNTVTLKSALENSYTTGNNAAVREVTPLSRVRMDNVRVIMSTSASGTGIGFFVDYAEDVEVTGCRFESAKAYGVMAWRSAGVRVRGCTFEELASSAVRITTGCRDVSVSDCDVRRITNGDAFYVGEDDYTNINVSITNCRVDGCLSGCQAGNARYFRFESNTILCDTGGASSAGTGIYVHNCTDFIVRGNSFRECGGIGILVETAITATDGTPFAGIIEGNLVRTTDNEGIAAWLHPNLIVRGNIVTGAGTSGIYAEDCTRCLIADNIVEDAGTHGIYIQSDTTTVQAPGILGNTVIDPGDSGIFLEATDSNVIILASIVGNRVVDVDSAADYCIHLLAESGAEITQVVISGNILERDDDLADNIMLQGGAAADVTSVIVTGNHMVNGAYAIGENGADANATNVVVGFNLTNGMAQAGTYEGTLSNAVAANDHNTDI